jgi:hypothetical protein
MAKATLVVLTNPVSPEVEDEYNDWYNNVHLKDVVAVEGFVGAQRFKIVETEAMAEAPKPAQRYLALYELDTDDIEGAAKRLTDVAMAGDGRMEISPALDAASALTFYVQPIGVRVTADTPAGAAS